VENVGDDDGGGVGLELLVAEQFSFYGFHTINASLPS
jgi:hypothetical protein